MMSDSLPLAAINVDQLSHAVNAVVNAAPPGHATEHDNNVSQSSMGVHLPTSSVGNTVMLQVDRRLLSHLTLPPIMSTNEVAGGPLMHTSGGFQPSSLQQQQQQQIRPLHQSIVTNVGIQNAQLILDHSLNGSNRHQAVTCPVQNSQHLPVLPQIHQQHQQHQQHQMQDQHMVIPPTIPSMVQATAAIQNPPRLQSTVLSSPLVLSSRNTDVIENTSSGFMTKGGGEQMLFNIQPDISTGSNISNANSSILQLVPITNSGISNDSTSSNHNPLINMSIAIHLPTHSSHNSKNPDSSTPQARIIPLSQLMTGQPIPVSHVTGPMQMALESVQQNASTLAMGDQFSTSGTQFIPEQSQTMMGTVQPFIPLSHFTMSPANTQECVGNTYTTAQLDDANKQTHIPQTVLHSLAASTIDNGAPLYTVYNTPTTTVPSVSTTTQVTTCNSTPLTAPSSDKGVPYLNMQALGSPMTITSQMTSDMTRPLTSVHSLDMVTIPSSIAASLDKARQQGDLDLGMVSISPDGLVASLSTDEMSTLDLGQTESIENLAMSLDMDTANVWCLDCNHYNVTTCTTHGCPVNIPDAEIPSRAILTLPSVLMFSDTVSNGRGNKQGVFAAEDIQPRCQFGPMIGKCVSKHECILDTVSNTTWKIFRNGSTSHVIDVSDPSHSNWMRFVGLASRAHEQNLVAHQSAGNIYFISNKLIQKSEELRVWYSKDYAHWRGVPEKPEYSFQCSQCPMQFLQRKQLIQHLGFKHPDMAARRYNCSSCPRAFISKTKLQLHTLTHMGLKPYKCNHCEKTFSDPSNRRIHTRIHTEEKRYICNTCQRAFRQKIHLISHMTTHTGERHLKCPDCDMKFGSHSTLGQHRYMHEPERKFQCKTCDREFRTHRLLQKHVKTHTGKREFECASCSKAFLTRYHAKRHFLKCQGPRKELEQKRGDGMKGAGDCIAKCKRGKGRPFKLPQPEVDKASTSTVSLLRKGAELKDGQQLTSLHSRRQIIPKDEQGSASKTIQRTATASSAEHGLSPDPKNLSKQGKQTGWCSRPVAGKVGPSSGQRPNGRPVRERKIPRRYAPESGPSSSDKATDNTKDSNPDWGSPYGVYNVNIADTRISVVLSPDLSVCNDHIAWSSSNNSTTEITADTIVNSRHFLDADILEDNEDSREQHLSSLIESPDPTTTSTWERLHNSTLTTTSQQTYFNASSPLVTSSSPMATGLSETTTVMSPSSFNTVPPVVTTMNNSLFAPVQMRREATSDSEANEHCTDEPRTGTVNDNVEE